MKLSSRLFCKKMMNPLTNGGRKAIILKIMYINPDSNKKRLKYTGCRTKQRKAGALLKTQSHQVSFRIYLDKLGLGEKIAFHPETKLD